MSRRDDAIYAFAVTMTVIGAVLGGLHAALQGDWAMVVQCVVTLVWMVTAVLWYNAARRLDGEIEDLVAAIRRTMGGEWHDE